MKKTFKCYQCGKENEFQTEEVKRYEVRLAESFKGSEDENIKAYIIECKYCKAENKIAI